MFLKVQSGFGGMYAETDEIRQNFFLLATAAPERLSAREAVVKNPRHIADKAIGFVGDFKKVTEGTFLTSRRLVTGSRHTA